MSCKKFVMAMDNELDRRGNKKLSEYEMQKKTDKEFKQTANDYKIGEFGNIIIYENEELGKVSQIFLNCSLDKGNVEEAKEFASMMAITLMGMEPNQVDKVEKELHIMDIKKGDTYRSIGENCKFLHIFDDSQKILKISPKNVVSQTSLLPETTDSAEAVSSEALIVNKVEQAKEISDELSKYMLDNFGGAGNPKYAADWYQYVKEFKVFKDGEAYYGELHLTETPLDRACRTLAFKYYNQNQADAIIPLLMDVAAAKNLDELDVAVISESMGEILRNNPNLKIYYASLFSYGIPVYKYLANGVGQGVTELQIIDNIEKCGGVTATAMIMAGIDADYGGSFEGLTMHEAETMSRAAMVNFKQVYLEKIELYSPDGEN